MPIPDPLPHSGFTIPLRASFLVLRRPSWLAIAHNNAAPELTLFEDHLRYRVLGRSTIHYREIDRIDVWQRSRTQNIIISPRQTLLAFSANVGEEDALTDLVRFFENRARSFSSRARSLLDRLT